MDLLYNRPAGSIVLEFRRFHEFRTVVIVWLVLAPATDMAISGTLVTFLRTSRTGFAATDDILSKLTRCRYARSLHRL